MEWYAVIPTIKKREEMAGRMCEFLGKERCEYVIDPIGNIILNHHSAWVKAFRKTDEWAMVLQDDIIFAPDFFEVLEYHLKNARERGMLVLSLFNRMRKGLTTDEEYYEDKREEFWHEQGVVMHKALMGRYSDYMLTHFRRKLLTRGHNCHDVIMGNFWKANKIKIWQVNPSIINHLDHVESTWYKPKGVNDRTNRMPIVSKTFLKKYGV